MSLTDERYKQLMVDVGMPNSRSLFQALQQVANEVEQKCEADKRVLGDLVSLSFQLVRALRKATPNNDLAERAMDYLKRERLNGSPLRAIEAEATKPQEPVAWKGLSDVQWMNIVNHDSCYLNQDKEDAVHLAVKLTEARLKGNNTTPQPCQRCAGKDQLIAEQNKLGKERQEWALKNAETIRELKTKCADLEQMHADICEIADDYRGKWLDLEALVTAENQRKQQLEAEHDEAAGGV